MVFVANWNSYDISVISTENYQVIKTIEVGAIPRGVEFTPDGKYAYVCNFGGSTISKIDAASLEVISTINNVGISPRDMVISSKGDYAYYSAYGDGYLRKLDLQTDEVVDKIKIGIQPRSVCITNNNKYLFVVNYQNGTVDAVDLTDFKIIGEYDADTGAVGEEEIDEAELEAIEAEEDAKSEHEKLPDLAADVAPEVVEETKEE